MFRVPTRVYFEEGGLSHVGEWANSLHCARMLLVVDEGLMATRWADVAFRELSDTGIDVTIVDTVEANPRYSTIDGIAGEARNASIDGVVALGGGSVMDAGKAIAMLITNDGSCLDYEGRNKMNQASVPFIAVPTTCGTGSEVTWVSVISDPASKRKFSVKGETMFPAAAIIDPNVLTSLPAHLVASTGMDAFTHAIEAYTGTCSNPFSDALAEKAILLLDRYLERAVRDIRDNEARREVMRASTIAGMAFGNADVGGVHCLSESIGGMFDVPHGLSNAILLAPVMRYHQPVIAEELTRLYRLMDTANQAIDQEEASAGMLDRIEALVSAIGLPRFDSLEVPESAYPDIAAASVANNSNGSNPQPMRASDYLAILNGLR